MRGGLAESEGNSLEPRLAGVTADRLHPSIGAGAADVDRMLAGEGAEFVRLRRHLGADSLCLGRRSQNDDPCLHGRAELVLVGLGDLLRRRFDLGVRQAAQGDHRPDNLVGVLLRRHTALVTDQLDPLLTGQIEALRHRLDLGIDQCGELAHGGRRSLGVGPLLRRRGPRRGSGGLPAQQRDLGIGLRVARPHAPGEAGQDDDCSGEQPRRSADRGGGRPDPRTDGGHGSDDRPPYLAHRKPSLVVAPASCQG